MTKDPNVKYLGLEISSVASVMLSDIVTMMDAMPPAEQEKCKSLFPVEADTQPTAENLHRLCAVVGFITGQQMRKVLRQEKSKETARAN